MPTEKEKIEIEKLSEISFDLTSPEDQDRLERLFPGGNFLFHGTTVESGIKILEGGGLKSVSALQEEEDERAARLGQDRSLIRNNSGIEGISWNFNNIGAMPGDRYHLMGFLACQIAF